MTSFLVTKIDVGIDPIHATSKVEVGVDSIQPTLKQDIGLDTSPFFATSLKD
jgi:hypothetical protein